MNAYHHDINISLKPLGVRFFGNDLGIGFSQLSRNIAHVTRLMIRIYQDPETREYLWHSERDRSFLLGVSSSAVLEERISQQYWDMAAQTFDQGRHITNVLFAIFVEDNVVGRAKVTGLDTASPMVGYALSPEVRGRGVGKVIDRKLVSFVFTDPRCGAQVESFFAGTYAFNTGMQKVLEHNGWQRVEWKQAIPQKYWGMQPFYDTRDRQWKRVPCRTHPYRYMITKSQTKT